MTTTAENDAEAQNNNSSDQWVYIPCTDCVRPVRVERRIKADYPYAPVMCSECAMHAGLIPLLGGTGTSVNTMATPEMNARDLAAKIRKKLEP